MKFLVVILIVISSLNMFGQVRDTLNIRNPIKVRNQYLGVYYGSLLNKLKQPLLGISYLKLHNVNLAHLFELWSYKVQDPNTWYVLSAALRYHFLNIYGVKIYIQGGMGMQVMFPILYADLGVNYTILNLSIRMIPPVPIPNSIIYLTLGINL